MQNAPASVTVYQTERQVRVCEFQNRTLFLHLPVDSFSVWICQRLLAFCAACTLALIAPFTTLCMYTQGHTDVQNGLILSIVMVVQVFFSSFGRILTDTAWRGGVICGKGRSSYRTSHLPCSAEAKTASTACWFFRPSSTVAAKRPLSSKGCRQSSASGRCGTGPELAIWRTRAPRRKRRQCRPR